MDLLKSNRIGDIIRRRSGLAHIFFLGALARPVMRMPLWRRKRISEEGAKWKMRASNPRS
jgi:hypothetical protein